MNFPKTLDEIIQLLKKTRKAKEIFGSEPQKTYHLLACITHPDRNPGDARANDIFRDITKLYESLKETSVTIKSKKRVYTLLKILVRYWFTSICY